MKWYDIQEKKPYEGQLCLVMNDVGNLFVARYLPGEKGQYQVKEWRFTLCPCCDEIGTINSWSPLEKEK